jgi:hypothetical protein
MQMSGETTASPERPNGYQDSLIALLARIEENNIDSDSASGLEVKYFPLSQKTKLHKDDHEMPGASAVLDSSSFTLYDHPVDRQDVDKDTSSYVARLDFSGEDVAYEIGNEASDEAEAMKKIEEIILASFGGEK